MPTITGSLNLVTDRPVDSINEVWVRARETRVQGDGLTVRVNDRVPVADGVVNFPAVPGAAVLVLVQNGMPLETLPMLITDEARQSLRLVVQAGQVAGAADRRVLEQLAAEVAANTARAEQYRAESAESASKAQAAQSAASSSASAAKTSETNAKTFETNAGDYAAVATTAATEATGATEAAADALVAIEARLAEMRAILNEVLAAKLTAFDGALTTDATGAAFAPGTLYMDVNTGIIYRKD
ncbi:hypothetical protein [Corynebacterium stationis]|uniref:hypothetical protein n=1 Tax=Corynebacterium stationis TaxID=1705 RepID=UPI00076F8028|nr:hypothetical protein [Corynebacterium stationis]AMJ43695.1 hypothetical protein AW169_01285 [Corynebacterium stationis]AQX70141.1 hypothetical protein CA21670_00410 [Corynebacterium stationis]ASJ17845.1 hypothetical protein BA700_01285 [Corynebacterium stationis]HJG64040.1 hypothetical protein [Corynebacterium stationis]